MPPSRHDDHCRSRVRSWIVCIIFSFMICSVFSSALPPKKNSWCVPPPKKNDEQCSQCHLVGMMITADLESVVGLCVLFFLWFAVFSPVPPKQLMCFPRKIIWLAVFSVSDMRQKNCPENFIFFRKISIVFFRKISNIFSVLSKLLKCYIAF